MVSEALDFIEPIAELGLAQGTTRYRDAGEGEPIVFVHGLLVDGSVWRKVLPHLAGEFRCVAPDWPMGSHKLAMSPAADLSALGMARLVVDFLVALDLDRVTVVGSNTGGAICQLLATRHPERLARAGGARARLGYGTSARYLVTRGWHPSRSELDQRSPARPRCHHGGEYQQRIVAHEHQGLRPAYVGHCGTDHQEDEAQPCRWGEERQDSQRPGYGHAHGAEHLERADALQLGRAEVVDPRHPCRLDRALT
jgi:pimeloyl-ACP methyl ester carboxylesterase